MGQLARYDAAAAGHRIARFGGGHVAAARPARGRRLLVADPAGADGDPVWPGT